MSRAEGPSGVADALDSFARGRGHPCKCSRSFCMFFSLRFFFKMFFLFSLNQRQRYRKSPHWQRSNSVIKACYTCSVLPRKNRDDEWDLNLECDAHNSPRYTRPGSGRLCSCELVPLYAPMAQCSAARTSLLSFFFFPSLIVRPRAPSHPTSSPVLFFCGNSPGRGFFGHRR